MTHKLGKNLRSGHIAEDIGILFLRSFCSVAKIRQEDDFGTDAVATLLRPEKGMLYAENSFFVQIKSSRLNRIEYADSEIDWLLNQDLPFFICSVDKVNQTIALYTTNPIFTLLVDKDVKKVELILSESPINEHSRFEKKDDRTLIYIGPPVILTKESVSRTAEFSNRAYKLMSEWVTKEFNLMTLRRLGITKFATWTTWNSPDYYGTMNIGSNDNITRDLEAIKPLLEYLSLHISFSEFGIKYEESLAFLILKKWFERNGLELDISEQELKRRVKWTNMNDYINNE